MRHSIRTFTTGILTIVIAVFFVGEEKALSQTIGFIGAGETSGDLNADAAAAFDLAESNYDVTYIAIGDIETDGLSAIEGNEVLWWHFDGLDGGTDLPPAATTESALNAFNGYVTSGGTMLLSGLASQLATAMEVNSDPPNWISHGEVESGDDWGFYQLDEDHPIFEGLQNPFYTVSAGLTFTESLAWFDEGVFDGTRLASIEVYDPNEPTPITTTGEWEHGAGRMMFVATGAYVFEYEGNNVYENELHLYTTNIIDYLASTATSSELDEEIPQEITLHQNYPNPFNPTTQISFELNTTTEVMISIHDMLGRKVDVPVNGETLQAGQHQVTFDASGLSSGIYIYKMNAGDQVQVRKMNFIK